MRLPKRLLPTTVTIAREVGIYGDYGPEVPVRCRLRYEARLIRKSDATEAVASALLTCGPGEDVRVGDRVTVPGGDQTFVMAVASHVGRRYVEVIEADLE